MLNAINKIHLSGDSYTDIQTLFNNCIGYTFIRAKVESAPSSENKLLSSLELSILLFFSITPIIALTLRLFQVA